MIEILLRPLRAFVVKALETYGLLRLETWVLQGHEASTGLPLCFSFSGAEALREYQASITLSPGYTVESLGKLFVFRVPAIMKRRFPGCDLSIFQLDERHQRISRFVKTDVKNPVWMPLEIDIRTSLSSSLKKRWFKDVFRSVTLHQFAFDVKTDDASFDHFYHDMYLPYIRARHGRSAVVSGYESLRDGFRKGELIFVRQGETVVAGATVNFNHREPRMMEMGVLGDPQKSLEQRIPEAVYFMTFARALELGGRTLMIGTSRGFLKDGPLNHKFHMGARVGKSHYRKDGLLYFRVLKRGAAVEAFFSNNPMIVLNQDGIYRAAFFAPAAVDADEMKGMFERCAEKNLVPRLYVTGTPADVSSAIERLRPALGDDGVRPASELLGRHEG